MQKKKSLGQHFLTEPGAARRIADALQPLSPGNRCLEIGPGEGALTRHLLARGDLELHVCELDDRFAARLPVLFPLLQNRVLHEDFLALNEAALPAAPFVLVGNFPYNISSQIIFRMLDWRTRIPLMVGMFQREVALRLCAGPGSKAYGVISVLAGAWYRAEYLFELPPSAFSPPPKVHSAVIRLHRRERDPLPDEALFRRLVKAAFQQRRKKLRNALQEFYAEEQLALPLFDRRAEDLSGAVYEAMAAAWPALPEELAAGFSGFEGSPRPAAQPGDSAPEAPAADRSTAGLPASRLRPQGGNRKKASGFRPEDNEAF